jgi:hypothetical protein
MKLDQSLGEADNQTGGPAAADGSTAGGPDIIFIGEERVRFGAFPGGATSNTTTSLEGAEAPLSSSSTEPFANHTIIASSVI